jgi:putative CocE/NonD family hydrolase
MRSLLSGSRGRVLATITVLVQVATVSSFSPWRILAAHLARQLDARPAQYRVRIDRHATLRTSDGTVLAADVFHPIGLDKTPTILVRLPYSKTLYNRMAASVVGTFWAERGYTAVLQGTRGRYNSGGAYYPLKYERQDGIDTLRWLKHQSWFDGRLAMWGGSYFGYAQWAISDQADPAPSAMMISIASTNFYDMFYPGGAFSLESALYWAVESRGRYDIEPRDADLDRGYAGFPLIEADNRATGEIGFFDDWAIHSSSDSYWRSIDGDDRAAHVRCPVFMMAGWSDPFLPAQLRDYAEIMRTSSPEITARSHLVIGPWSHAHSVKLPDGPTSENYRLASLAPSIPWFDQIFGWPSSQSFPPVRIFVMGINVWRDENEWPLRRTRFTSYYLNSSGSTNGISGVGLLTLDPPAADEPEDHFTFDPKNPVPTSGGAMIGPHAGYMPQNKIETRPDMLLYSTTPLKREIEVTGPVRAILYVSTDAPCTDFTAKLVDVRPDGTAYNVSDGIIRRSYAGPNRVERIEIELWPTSIVFMRGHRIRLEISSSNFPRYDRNPNTGRDIATETQTRIAAQSVYHSTRAMSQIILPIIPR